MRVLIIEDEPTIARILERKLIKKGYEPEKVDTIADAKLKLVGNFDLVFLDFVLKDGRATDLLDDLNFKKIPRLIMMSAFMDEIDKTVFSESNIIKFLIKPFDDIDTVIDEL